MSRRMQMIHDVTLAMLVSETLKLSYFIMQTLFVPIAKHNHWSDEW